ncbi:MAG: pilus assembly protein N-terminal domain-containing protein [Candidatus Omnitrophota bacterium]
MAHKVSCFYPWVRGLVIFAMFFTCVPASPLFAEANSNMDVRVRYLQWPSNDVARSDTLYLSKDTSQVLRFDRNIARTAVSNSELCDFTPLSPKEILIYAKKPGLSNLIVWDDKDKIATYDVYSVLDTDKLKDILKSIDPDNFFRVVPFNETLAVYGMTSTAAKLKQIAQAVTSYDAKAVSFVTVKDPKQILLEVRFAEITRNGAEDYGLDLEAFLTTRNHVASFRSLYGGNALNTDATNLVRPSPFAKQPFGSMVGPAFSDLDSTSSADIVATVFGKNFTYAPILEWLQSKNVLKLIARPNLLAKDGEEAKFLVGGEYPVPLQTATAIEIDYKSYGTQLNFTPEILDNNVIRLKVKTEVSELDYANTVTLGGNTVPSIIERKHETVAELKDGETLMVGGMITQRISEVQRKLPILGDLPGLKFLFQRKEYSRGDVELVVIITPHIVSSFELQEKKKFFSPEMVKKLEEAVEVYQPGFHDLQGDAINQVIIQGEQRADFAEWRRFRDRAILDDVNAQHKLAKREEKVPPVVMIPVTVQPVPVPQPVPEVNREMETALTQVDGSSAVAEEPEQLSERPSLWSRISSLWKKEDVSSEEEEDASSEEEEDVAEVSSDIDTPAVTDVTPLEFKSHENSD